MKFSAKYRVLCLELKQDRGQLQMGRGAAGEGKRGGPPLYTGLAGALFCKNFADLNLFLCVLVLL